LRRAPSEVRMKAPFRVPTRTRSVLMGMWVDARWSQQNRQAQDVGGFCLRGFAEIAAKKNRHAVLLPKACHASAPAAETCVVADTVHPWVVRIPSGRPAAQENALAAATDGCSARQRNPYRSRPRHPHSSRAPPKGGVFVAEQGPCAVGGTANLIQIGRKRAIRVSLEWR
jgi:hypothetical protein